MTDQPNPITVALAILRAKRVARPDPSGSGALESLDLATVLDTLRTGGIARLPEERGHLSDFRFRMEATDPDSLSDDGALAFWLNLYNAGALAVAADAFEDGAHSILRIPGVFDAPWATIAGEPLSLNDIEHGKLRRFGDPRIHGALVCGSVI